MCCSTTYPASGVLLIGHFEPPTSIKAPAQCNTCMTIYQSPTTGNVMNRCHCGGTLHTLTPKEN